MITGIVVALPEEIGTLTSNNIAKGSYAFLSDNLIVACSGAGINNAQTAARLLIEHGATRLLSWGCAAALAKDLYPGDLVLADSLIDSQKGTDANGYVDSEWHQSTKALLAQHLTVHTGKLAESRAIVETAADKNRLHTQYGAIALDMESVAIAKVASENALSFLAIRVIADPANMNLPKAINHSLNNQGEIVLTKLLIFLVQHPAELPGLVKLGLHFNTAKKTLRLIAKHLKFLP